MSSSNIPSVAQWTWNTSALPNGPPVIVGYNNGSPTKTGLSPADLQNFIGVPACIQTTPPTPISDSQLLQIIRQAEDWVEQTGGILLCETWIGSPPLDSVALLNSTGFPVQPQSQGIGQQQGVDYDLVDIGYDFFVRRYIADGWGIQQMRYRPLRTVYMMQFIYPLLSQFFQIPLSWVVVDKDYGMIRVVPSANVQMLPLFALQLSLVGFAESLPQALYFQYTAGLSPIDYTTRYAFIKTLVLSAAAVYLLQILQGSVNFGVIRQSTSVDGLKYESSYPSSGAAYSGIIMAFANQRDTLLRACIDLVRGGPTMISL